MKLAGVVKNAFLAFILVFLYAPIFVLILYSFNESRTMAHWTGFSLQWYRALLQDTTIMSALLVTVSVAVIASLVSTVLGTFAAIGINVMARKSRMAIEFITNIPVVNPDIVTGISLMLLFIFFRITLSYTTLLLSHITFCVPYVILSVMPKLSQMRDQTYEAALDLGATPLYAIYKVVLPEIKPGITTGAILAFTLSLDDFVVSLFTRQGVQTLSTLIYSMARRGINPKINALSAVVFVAVLVLLMIVNLRTESK
jgi:spermidine/putrescine transport system permease protein